MNRGLPKSSPVTIGKSVGIAIRIIVIESITQPRAERRIFDAAAFSFTQALSYLASSAIASSYSC